MGKCSFFAEMLERVAFEYLPVVLSRYVGDEAASALIFNVMKEAAMDGFREFSKSFQVEVKNLKDALLACYLPYKEMGRPFGYEVVSEEPVIVRVTKCPHIEFTRKKPIACVTCGAIKVGVLEVVTGKRVRLEAGKAKYGAREADIIIRRTKHMPSGDPYCEFVVEEVKK